MKTLWEKSERNARYLLSERLCDSLCLKIQKLETAAARWEFLERSYGRPENVLAEVLPPRRAEEVEKMSPKSKNQSDEGATYLERELAAVAKSSGPEGVRAAVAFDKADGGVTMGGIHGLVLDFNVDFVEETGDRCAVIYDNCESIGGGLFEFVDEDPDFEGVWSCNVPLDYKVISDDGINDNDVPVFDHPLFSCPSPVPEFDSPAAVMADENCDELVEGPDAWNDCLAAAGRGEDKQSRVLSYTEPPVAGWAAKGAVSVLEEPETTESVGRLPCNTLGVPTEAAVITIVCAEAHAESQNLDKAARGIGWSQDATKAVALGTGSAAGHQTDAAEYGDTQDSPLDVSQSLVDLGDVAQDAPSQDGCLSEVGVPFDMAQVVPGQDGQLSKASTLFDVARDAPERFATEVVEQATRREARRLWNEHRKSRVRSEGERCVGFAGGTHATCAGSRGQRKRLKFELTHLVYPESHSLCRRYRRRRPMPRGRPPDARNRCTKVCVGAGAQDTRRKRNLDAKGLQRPVFTVPEPIGCPVRARELYDIDPAARSARHAPCNRPVATMASRPERPPELEGEYPKCGRRVADPIYVQLAQKPTKTNQYTNPKPDDVPGCPVDAESTPAKPLGRDGTPRDDDADKELDFWPCGH